MPRLLRTRVNDRIARAARSPVTLIVAPAGFGKSVALRDFLETARVDAVRYDVGREDTTLLAFVGGLAAALEPVAPTALAAYPAVQQRVLAGADPVRELADWFDEHLKRTVCTVVIDDLHHAAGDPGTVPLLTMLVERTSERIRWIIAARSDVGLPVASWIAYGRMDYPVGEDDLRFTVDEAFAAADDDGTLLDADEVEALRELTGGWPVAVAIALRTRMHAADLRTATSGARELVYRYLAEQVVAGLTPEQRQFLIETSVYPSFDLAIAEAHGCDPEAFVALRRAVTFIGNVAGDEYRYHDLFRDFLESELRLAGPRAWVDAHARAGAILEERGDLSGALAAYTRGPVPERILDLVERHGLALFERGASQGLVTALDAVPEELRREHPAAIGVRATIQAARGRFEIAERGFVAAIERAADIELKIALVHRYAIELVRHDRDARDVLAPYARDTALPERLRVPLLGTLATAEIRAGRVTEARVAMRTALDALDPFPDDVRARIFQQAAYVEQFAPRFGEAHAYATHAVELALRHGLYDVAARAYSVLYTIESEFSDDPISTLAILDRLAEYARKAASAQARAFAAIAAYQIEAERGDDAALEALDRELATVGDALPQTRAEALLPAQALRAAGEGDHARAYELLAGTAETQHGDDRRALRSAEIALYAVAAGNHDGADAAYRDAASALERTPPGTRRVVRARLVLALVELARGRATAAHRLLSEAERQLTPPMRRLRALAFAARALHRIATGNADPATVAGPLERLRAEHFGGFARVLAAIDFPRGERGGYALLTPAEREILALLARGASSKDVAARTGRSPQTVDTHIRALCRKLGCQGRREAVALALEAGWISMA